MTNEDRNAVIERLEALRAEIGFHQYQYYVENRPTISDADYDVRAMAVWSLDEINPSRDS